MKVFLLEKKVTVVGDMEQTRHGGHCYNVPDELAALWLADGTAWECTEDNLPIEPAEPEAEPEPVDRRAELEAMLKNDVAEVAETLGVYVVGARKGELIGHVLEAEAAADEEG